MSFSVVQHVLLTKTNVTWRYTCAVDDLLKTRPCWWCCNAVTVRDMFQSVRHVLLTKLLSRGNTRVV